MQIFLVGFMGSGKSHTGRILAERLNLPFMDLDDWIEEKTGMSIAKIFESKGESYFRQLEAKSLRAIGQQDKVIIACGGGTPCFHQNMKWMNQVGISIFLDCSPELLFQRLQKGRLHRPLLKGKSDQELQQFIAKKTAERLPHYAKAKIHILQEKEDSQLSDQIIAKISRFTSERS